MGAAETGPFDRWFTLFPFSPETYASKARQVCAPHFVYERHRRLVGGGPPMNLDEYIAYMADYRTFVQIESARHEVIATRGDRLLASRAVITTTEGDEIHALGVVRLTPDLAKMEWLASYEPEDLDIALAELDRQHAELEGN